MAGKLTKLIIALLFEGALLLLIIWHFTVAPLAVAVAWWTVLVIAVGVAVSNIASSVIVGFVKDEVLWKRVNEAGGKDKGLTVQERWKAEHLGSPISNFVGITERVLLVAAGMISWTVFGATAGAWLTLKVTCNWRAFSKIEHRAVSDIYLISNVLSFLLAAIDVLAIRAVCGLQ